DRKSTRLNSSHVKISYAVFCLKKKNSCLGQVMIHQEGLLERNSTFPYKAHLTTRLCPHLPLGPMSDRLDGHQSVESLKPSVGSFDMYVGILLLGRKPIGRVRRSGPKCFL